MELNQKLDKVCPEDARYGAFTQGKDTYVKKIRGYIERGGGGGVSLKGAYLRELMVLQIWTKAI